MKNLKSSGKDQLVMAKLNEVRIVRIVPESIDFYVSALLLRPACPSAFYLPGLQGSTAALQNQRISAAQRMFSAVLMSLASRSWDTRPSRSRGVLAGPHSAGLEALSLLSDAFRLSSLPGVLAEATKLLPLDRRSFFEARRMSAELLRLFHRPVCLPHPAITHCRSSCCIMCLVGALFGSRFRLSGLT